MHAHAIVVVEPLLQAPECRQEFVSPLPDPLAEFLRLAAQLVAPLRVELLEGFTLLADITADSGMSRTLMIFGAPIFSQHHFTARQLRDRERLNWPWRRLPTRRAIVGPLLLPAWFASARLDKRHKGVG